MLLKILFLAIVLYYVVKTSRALIRAISRDGTRSSLEDRAGNSSPGWEGRAARRPEYEDVEDAKYVDIK